MFEPLYPAAWEEFFFTIAAASAALIGLIIVGLSIHADFIAQSLTHRSHARATLIILTATVVIGVAAQAPQPPALADGAGGGLYWIALETIGALVWAIAGAWRFLIGVTDERRA